MKQQPCLCKSGMRRMAVTQGHGTGGQVAATTHIMMCDCVRHATARSDVGTQRGAATETNQTPGILLVEPTVRACPDHNGQTFPGTSLDPPMVVAGAKRTMAAHRQPVALCQLLQKFDTSELPNWTVLASNVVRSGSCPSSRPLSQLTRCSERACSIHTRPESRLGPERRNGC